MGDGHPVADARGAQILPVKQHLMGALGVELGPVRLNGGHQFRQHLGLGLRRKFPDDKIGLEIVL